MLKISQTKRLISPMLSAVQPQPPSSAGSRPQSTPRSPAISVGENEGCGCVQLLRLFGIQRVAFAFGLSPPPPSRVLGQGLRSRFGFASRRAVGGKIFYFWFGGFDRPAGCCETQRCNSSGALDEDSLAKPYLPKPRSHFCGCLSNQL